MANKSDVEPDKWANEVKIHHHIQPVPANLTIPQPDRARPLLPVQDQEGGGESIPSNDDSQEIGHPNP